MTMRIRVPGSIDQAYITVVRAGFSVWRTRRADGSGELIVHDLADDAGLHHEVLELVRSVEPAASQVHLV